MAISAVSIGVVLILILGWQWYARQSLPEYSGEFEVKGLKEGVRIVFNDRGVPQIWADNDDDLYFALGWQHAGERLFQMEMVRRVSRGRLAEIFGEAALSFDINIRRLGFEAKALREINSVDTETRVLLQGYVDGINAKIDHFTYLPPEFILLGTVPQEWDIVDVGAILIYQTWFSHALMNTEARNHDLLEKFGDELAPFMREVISWSPPTIHSKDISAILGPELYPLRMGNASNAFAISPGLSNTGSAILASDPHLQVNQLPGFWYAVGMHSESGTNVVGITVPGLPFLAMGHNGEIAWAFTVAAVDIIDYYAEPLKKDDSLQYRIPGGWERMEVSKEYFFIKGDEKPVEKTFFRTRHGVVTDFKDSIAVAMHWAGYDFKLPEMLKAVVSIHKSNDFNSFREVVTKVGALNVNWAFADAKGNIGYQLGVPVPVRNYDNTFQLLPGDSAFYDWLGYLPLSLAPHLLNPKSGWLATCNNQPQEESSRQTNIPGFYDPYRIIRASEVLAGADKISTSDLRKLQMDLISPQVRRWKDLLSHIAGEAGKMELSKKINSWNGSIDGESQLAGLFYLWWEYLPDAFLGDEMNSSHVNVVSTIVEGLLELRDASWIDDINTEKIESWEDNVKTAFGKAYDHWNNRKWKNMTRISFRHMLDKSVFVSTAFNWSIKDLPYQGSQSTLNANYFFYKASDHTFPVYTAPSMRMIVNFANIDSSTLYLPAGQSGHPYSPHYSDQVQIWMQDSNAYIPFSWEAVVVEQVSQVVLIPR